jgi:methylenetetrahydrofolate dehydrogenase (NADP+) / methenyltetrahydrofolate cyclohydrolase
MALRVSKLSSSKDFPVLSVRKIPRILRDMQLIDGKALAVAICEELKQEIKRAEIQPKLAVLLVGDDPASQLYVSMKEKKAAEVGIATDIKRLPADVSDLELIRHIRAWNEDVSVHGILVQVPLPDGHDTDAIIEAIDPLKDVDGFHQANLTALYDGRAHILSPVHEGVLRLIAQTGINMNGAKAVILANSIIFSKPLEYLLKKAGCFVQTFTPEELEPNVCKAADIIVVAIGRPNFLDNTHVKTGAVVIDVGTNKQADGKTVGDVNAEALKNINGWLTPVPGGVGPMTIALLLKNVVALASNVKH